MTQDEAIEHIRAIAKEAIAILDITTPKMQREKDLVKYTGGR